jgi:hypothetical protein
MSRWEVPDALGQLKDHFLEQVLDADKFKAFYMREEPNSRMMSTLFMFHPEGITICGDLSPALHGNCSALGYGLSWFAGRLSEGYLCEKFLERGWHADLAESELAQMSKDSLLGKNDHESWMGIDDIWNDREALVLDLLELRGNLKAADGKDERVAIKGSIRAMRPMLVEARKKLATKREELADKLDDLATSMPGQDGLYDEWLEHFENDSEGLPGYGYAPRERVWLCALQQKFSELYHKKTGTTPD